MNIKWTSLLLLMSCGIPSADDCTNNTSCTMIFGPGSVCRLGTCEDVVVPDGCDDASGLLQGAPRIGLLEDEGAAPVVQQAIDAFNELDVFDLDVQLVTCQVSDDNLLNASVYLSQDLNIPVVIGPSISDLAVDVSNRNLPSEVLSPSSSSLFGKGRALGVTDADLANALAQELQAAGFDHVVIIRPSLPAALARAEAIVAALGDEPGIINQRSIDEPSIQPGVDAVIVLSDRWTEVDSVLQSLVEQDLSTTVYLPPPGHRSQLQGRGQLTIRGFWTPISEGPAGAIFRQRISNPGYQDHLIWDATWMGLSAMTWSAKRAGTMSPREIGLALNQMSRGVPITLGPDQFPYYLTKIDAAVGVDIQGASGPLDFPTSNNRSQSLRQPVAFWSWTDSGPVDYAWY